LQNQVLITTQDLRPRNIAVGFVVVLVLSWWQFTGSLPLIASTMLPSESDEKVSSVYSFVSLLLADGLYAVGVLATLAASGIWSLVVSLLGKLLGYAKRPAETEPTRVDTLVESIERELNSLDSRISALEHTPKAVPRPRTRKGTA
jgi:hypothetical protein